MWDDFYNEPSEFDMKMEELKESLMESVREEYIEKMNQLEKENESLRGIKEHFDKIKKDYENKKRDLDIAIRNAKSEAQRMRAEEVMEKFKVVLWAPKRRYVFGPKCSKCDRYRKVAIELPSGKIVQDDCLCSKSEIYIHAPERKILEEISDRDSKIVAWYKSCRKSNGGKYYDLEFARDAYYDDCFVKPGTDFSALDENKDHLFNDLETCKAYCEYLNKKNGVPDGTLYNQDGTVFQPEYLLEAAHEE